MTISDFYTSVFVKTAANRYGKADAIYTASYTKYIHIDLHKLLTDCINGGRKKYPIVLVMIKPTSPVSMGKIQMKCSFRARVLSLIST